MIPWNNSRSFALTFLLFLGKNVVKVRRFLAGEHASLHFFSCNQDLLQVQVCICSPTYLLFCQMFSDLNLLKP